MKRLKFFALAALLVLPMTACDEGEDDLTGPAVQGTVTGTVTIDGAGAAGVTVSLSSGATATTDASGRYQFNNVPAGAYTVTISGFPADAAFASTSQAVVISTAGQVVTVDFAGSFVRTSSIFGSVSSGGAALEGVTVTLSGAASATTTTDASGQYSFGGLRAGSYTVSIAGVPSNQTCGTTSQSVTLASGETQVVSFSCTPSATGRISGRMFLDENDKNDQFDGTALEGDLEVANVAITLEGPEVGQTQTTQTDADGQYAFTDLRPGVYNVSIASTDPQIPSNVEYGGNQTTFAVTLAAGDQATVNFPFDIVEQQVRAFAFLGRDGTNPGVAPAPDVVIDLYPTEADLTAGTNRIGRDTTDMDGEVTFTFDREDDTSPSGSSPDRIVFAQVQSTPPFHVINGETKIEIEYDATMLVDQAPDTFDLLNTRVVLGFDALTTETRAPLADWNAALWRNDTTAATIQNGNTNANGRILFTENTGLAALPDTFYMRLSGAQPNANGHGFEQDPEAQERASTAGRYIRVIHDGTVPLFDTLDAGNEIVTFTDSDVLVRVHHEQDDSTDIPTLTGGDDFENVDNISVRLTWGDSIRTTTPSPVDGTATFVNIPTNAGPYMLEASPKVGFQHVLMDTLVQIGEVKGGDLDGQGQAILVCPLGENTVAECSTFAHKYNNTSIIGKVKSADSTAAVGAKVTVTPHPMNIQPNVETATLTTDANGRFSISGLREGPWIVSVADSIGADTVWTFRPPNNRADTLDMEGNSDNDIINFIVIRGDTKVQGVAVNDRDADANTIDPNEALPGVIVQLYRDGSGAPTTDTLVATDTTDANGAYSFDNLFEGRYIVKGTYSGDAVVLRGFTATGARIDTAVVTTAATTTGAGANNTRTVGSTSPVPLPRWDYDESKANFITPAHFTFLYNTGTATGTVTTAGGAPVEGMTMTLRRCDDSAGSTSPPSAGNCTTYFPGFTPVNQSTNASGEFAFGNLQEGVYEVTSNPTTAGFTSTTPSSRLFRIVGPADVETGNYTAN